MTRTVLIGVGNSFRGDDGAGLEVARFLDGVPYLEVVENGGDPAELIEAWDGADLAVVVDAGHAHDPPGTVRVHEGLDLPAVTRSSTHGLSVLDALALGEALGRLPGRLVVCTIEGADFALGAPVSAPVALAARALAHACREPEFLQRIRGSCSPITVSSPTGSPR